MGVWLPLKPSAPVRRVSPSGWPNIGALELAAAAP